MTRKSMSQGWAMSDKLSAEDVSITEKVKKKTLFKGVLDCDL